MLLNRFPQPARILLALAAALPAWLGAMLLARATGMDARPVLLLAPAVAALGGGMAPGLIAAVAAGVIAGDPVTGATGALLALLCALSSGNRRRRDPLTTVAIPPPDPTPVRRVSVPAPVEHTTEATWRFHHEEPLDITLPEDEQVEHMYLHSYLAECNDAFARMYGFGSAADVVGTRLVVFLPPSDPSNPAFLRDYIRSGYRLEDAESHEIDRYGNRKYFVNNLVAIFERGRVVGAWGTQRDVTGHRRRQAEAERGVGSDHR